MRYFLCLMSLVLLAVASYAGADEVSYSWLKIHALEQKVDGVAERNQGLRLAGSMSFSEQFVVALSHQSSDDSDNDDISSQQTSLALGLHNSVKRLQRARVATFLGYRQAELDLGRDALEESAAFIRVELRSHHYKNVELRGHMEYVDWDVSQSGFAGGFGLSYFFVKGFALEVDFQEVGNTQSYSAGMAYHF